MAQFEKPINQIDFVNGDQPSEIRLEEKYLHKYFEMKPPKIKSKTGLELNEDGEDAELEAFADKAIEDKMKEL